MDAEQGEGVAHPVCNTSDSSFPLCFAFLPSFSNRDDEMQKIFRENCETLMMERLDILIFESSIGRDGSFR